MKKVAIVVPVYREILTKSEEIAYKQLFAVLGEYDIFFACPEGLNASYIKKNMALFFNKNFFASILDYNRLMLSLSFYQVFKQYEFILIYQLDALVFSDKLTWFCNLKYDYIGAPWLTGCITQVKGQLQYIHVGNGGLSLRNVEACTKLLIDHGCDEMFLNNEDYFFASHETDYFKIAPREIALKFSFEREVRKCYVLNQNELPFGCHAWEKYDLKFWEPIIKSLGYDLSFIVENGNLDEVNKEYYAICNKRESIWNGERRMKDSLIEGRTVFLWGGGLYGKQALKLLTNRKITIGGIIDSDIKKVGMKIEGYEVFSPQILLTEADIFVVITISIDGAKEVIEKLRKLGKKKGKDYIYDVDLWK